jgi:hypothetical protein
MPKTELETAPPGRFHISPLVERDRHVLDDRACPCDPQVYEETSNSLIIVHRRADGSECHDGVASGWRRVN